MFQTTTSAGSTRQLGERIAAKLGPNDVVALYGELGAGKTTLIQGIAKGLGISNWVTSPTFTIINEFPGELPLYHIDLYRLECIGDIEDMGIEEYFTKGGVTVVEWAEKMKELLPEDTINIKIQMTSENTRKFEIKGVSL